MWALSFIRYETMALMCFADKKSAGSSRCVARTLTLEMSSSTLGKWVSQARKGQSVSARSARAPVGEMEAEVSRLRQEVARLKVENEILKKAAAYFAKESM